jgi:hypothetical protein
MPRESSCSTVSNLGAGWQDKYVMIARSNRYWFSCVGVLRPRRVISIVRSPRPVSDIRSRFGIARRRTRQRPNGTSLRSR